MKSFRVFVGFQFLLLLIDFFAVLFVATRNSLFYPLGFLALVQTKIFRQQYIPFQLIYYCSLLFLGILFIRYQGILFRSQLHQMGNLFASLTLITALIFASQAVSLSYFLHYYVSLVLQFIGVIVTILIIITALRLHPQSPEEYRAKRRLVGSLVALLLFYLIVEYLLLPLLSFSSIFQSSAFLRGVFTTNFIFFLGISVILIIIASVVPMLEQVEVTETAVQTYPKADSSPSSQ